MVEIIGYIASILVAVSLSMSSVLRLRWLNLIGAITFSLYGLLIKAWPVFIVNFYISLMDIYYLIKLYQTKDKFGLALIEDTSKTPVSDFLSEQSQDIDLYFPQHKERITNASHIFGLYRNFKLIGIFAIQKVDSTARVLIDYVTPEFRDFKFGQYIYSELPSEIRQLHINKFMSESFHRIHSKYLKKLGFHEEKTNLYVKERPLK
ncbi:MAG: hypothetical protein Kow00108_21560 [Calditrichia bacterium]